MPPPPRPPELGLQTSRVGGKETGGGGGGGGRASRGGPLHACASKDQILPVVCVYSRPYTQENYFHAIHFCCPVFSSIAHRSCLGSDLRTQGETPVEKRGKLSPASFLSFLCPWLRLWFSSSSPFRHHAASGGASGPYEHPQACDITYT